MNDLVVNKTKWNKALVEATQDLSREINTMLLSLIRSHYEHNDARFNDICDEVIKYFDANGKGELSEYIMALKGDVPTWTTQDSEVNK